MKIAILSIGSEGDVRPYIALGQELQSERHANPPHEVYLVTHGSSKSRVEASGLHFADIGKDPVVELRDSELGKAINDAGVFGKMGAVKAFFTNLVEEWFQKGDSALTSIKPDIAVLGTFPMNLHSVLCSDVLNIPFCQIHLMPIIPTVDHAPPVGFGDAQSWKCIARLKWKLSMSAGFSMLYAAPLEKAYSPYGVAVSNEKLWEKWTTAPAVLGYSDILSPRPGDYDEEKVQIVGPLMDETSKDDIDSFLETKDGKKLVEFFKAEAPSDRKPRVFVGFGSMWEVFTDQEKQTLLTEIIGCAKVLENETNGFIVQCDEASFDNVKKTVVASEMPDNFTTIQSAPHSWLFPKVDIVVCHGGSGTTHKALLHSCATIVCPCKPADSDQPFWAGCVARAGLGVHGPTATSLRKSKFVKCVRQILNSPGIRKNVQAASETMKKQDGIKSGAKAVLRFAGA